MNEVDEDIDEMQRIIEGRCLTCESLYLHRDRSQCVNCIQAAWIYPEFPMGPLDRLIKYVRQLRKDSQ